MSIFEILSGLFWGLLYFINWIFFVSVLTGIQMGSEDPHHHHMDAHHKLLIALIIACSALCLIILALLCLWLYHLKYSFKSSNKNAKSKGTIFIYFF